MPTKMPSFSSIIFGVVLAGLVFFGMSTFFVGTYEAYSVETLDYDNSSMVKFTEKVTELMNPFSESKSEMIFDEWPVINVITRGIFAIGTFITMPATLAGIAIESLTGLAIVGVLDDYYISMVWFVITFLFIVAIIRVLSPSGREL